MERGEIFPSLTVDVNSPTPYTDATQVNPVYFLTHQDTKSKSERNLCV